MKAAKILVLILFLMPVQSFAGEIYGTISKGGVPFANMAISITDPNGEVFQLKTDDKGYFTVLIQPLGECTLTVEEGCKIAVFSNEEPNGYNLNFNKGADPCLTKL